MRWLATFLYLTPALLAGCSVPDLDLSEKTCPCIAGWTCDTAANVCVQDGEDGGVADAAVADAGMARETYASCAAALAAGETSDGVYLLEPVGGEPAHDVYCDMTTDDGGWTLVASTRTETLNDEASAYYEDLATLDPANGNEGVWDGLTELATRFDVRFTCRAEPGPSSAPFVVDLSFYDVIWYAEWTTGTDADSCFSEGDEGANADTPIPARRDNVADASLPEGDPYSRNMGFLEGEDACDDRGDFTVDFDDRGMDANEDDGTDWGEDDSVAKCGTSALPDGQWFIFVRER